MFEQFKTSYYKAESRKIHMVVQGFGKAGLTLKLQAHGPLGDSGRDAGAQLLQLHGGLFEAAAVSLVACVAAS